MKDFFGFTSLLIKVGLETNSKKIFVFVLHLTTCHSLLFFFFIILSRNATQDSRFQPIHAEFVIQYLPNKQHYGLYNKSVLA